MIVWWPIWERKLISISIWIALGHARTAKYTQQKNWINLPLKMIIIADLTVFAIWHPHEYLRSCIYNISFRSYFENKNYDLSSHFFHYKIQPMGEQFVIYIFLFYAKIELLSESFEIFWNYLKLFEIIWNYSKLLYPRSFHSFSAMVKFMVRNLFD